MKTFRQFIAESPYAYNEINKRDLDDFNSNLSDLKDVYVDKIKKYKHIDIKDNFYKIKTSYIGGHTFFKKESPNSEPTSIVSVSKDLSPRSSTFGKNTFIFMHKNNGSKEDFYHSIRKAIDHYGELYTDNQHSPGAIHFHKNFHENFPDMEMHHITPDKKEIITDKKYLEDNHHKIWGTTDDHMKNLLRIRRKTSV